MKVESEEWKTENAKLGNESNAVPIQKSISINKDKDRAIDKGPASSHRSLGDFWRILPHFHQKNGNYWPLSLSLSGIQWEGEQ